MSLEIITVGNGSKEYPGDFTKKEIDIILDELEYPVLNLFSGKSNIGTTRIDYKYGTINIDVFDYLEYCPYFSTVIVDAPYNKKFADIYQKIGGTPKQFIIFANTKKTTELFDKIRLISPEIIILKSWNYYVPNGYALKKGYLCYAGGYRKPTILLILHKI